MSYSKELLLAVATTFVSIGTITIQTDIIKGGSLLLIGVIVFIARGFYKKYLDN